MRIWIVLLWAVSVWAAPDQDMDGVADTEDRCPNTPWSDLADEEGCTTVSLDAKDHYSVRMGYAYTKASSINRERTHTLSWRGEYQHKEQWRAIVDASYYQFSSSEGDTSGFNDISFLLSYLQPINETYSISISGGIIAPAYRSGYNNEAADYTCALGWMGNHQNPYFIQLSYTMVQDRDIPSVVSYHNTLTVYGGKTISLDPLSSLSLGYNYAQSAYVGNDPYHSLIASYYHTIDTHWFVMAHYVYGLGESEDEYGCALGYFW